MAHADWYVVGDMNEWTYEPSKSDKITAMSNPSGDNDTYSIDFTINGIKNFCIADGDGSNWGDFHANHRYAIADQAITLDENYILGLGENTLNFTGDGSIYRFTFVASTKTLTISKVIATIGTVKLAGSFNGWKGGDADCIILSKVGDTNVYTCDIDTWTDDTEFKLIANDLWMGYTNVTSIDAPDGWVVNSGEFGNFLLKHSSLPTNYLSYTITATWTPNSYANEGWAIKIEGKEPKPNATISSVQLAGEFSNWEKNPEKFITLNRVGETNTYTCDVDWDTDMQFKLIANTSSSANWIGYRDVTSITAPTGWVTESDETNKNFKLNHSSLPTHYQSYTITATWTPSPNANQGWAIAIAGKIAAINTVTFSWGKTGESPWTNVSLDKDEYTYTKLVDMRGINENRQFKLVVNDTWLGQGQITVVAPDGWITNGANPGDDITLNNANKVYSITATWTPGDDATAGWTVTIAEATPSTYTASFVNGEKWANVSAYAWKGTPPSVTEFTATFPGDVISKTGTATYNATKYDVYTYSYNYYADFDEVPAKIIFSDGASSETTNKTGDLTFVNGMLDDSKVTKVPVYAVVGSNASETDAAFFDGKWNVATTTDLMTENEGIWSKTFSNVTLTENVIFKVIKKAYLEATTATNYYPSEFNITITERGKYNIVVTFNKSTENVAYTPTKLAEAVSVGDAGWATYKAGENLDFSNADPTGINAYTAKVSGGTVTLTNRNNVPQNEPVVLKANKGTYYVPVLASADVITNNDLQWFAEYYVNTGYYVYGLTKDTTDDKAKFARINTGQTVNNKAILVFTSDPVPSGARELQVVFEDETTGISQIENAQPATIEDAVIYNLNGQRVMNPGKGLYIVNGKKVIMK